MSVLAFAPRPEVRRFVLIQLGAMLLSLAVAQWQGAVWPLALVPLWAVLAAWRWHDGRWWRLIHFLFPLLVFGAAQLSLAPGWYLLAFCLSWLVFGQVARTGVPLYLSNRQALAVLGARLPPAARLLDVGAGTGTVLAWLARTRPDLQLSGIEQAWLPWWIGRWRLPRRVVWQRGDYQHCSLAEVDVLYAFLSPIPMPALWQKARAEMAPGSWFISNTFAVPGETPDEVIELNDWKQGKLLLWRM